VEPIEVFADVCCPFTHVGLRRLVERRAQLGRDQPRLRIRAWPLELVNGHPLDPALIAHEIAELRAQVAPDLFVGFDAGAFPATSMPALALVSAAYRRDLATGEAVSLALRDALFEHGRDIADRAVLAEIAAGNGVGEPDDDDRERPVDDWHEGQRRGVVGSPYFFVATGPVFCPTLEITKVDGRLHITTDADAVESFMVAALGS
jgi:predicted DsbA family dithiol-disulfide isomerase